MDQKWQTNNKDETEKIGAEIASHLNGGDIVLLYGELGAGKTTLTKGIAQGLGIKKTINSPTFTLMNVYEARSHKPEIRNLIHIDTYRLKNEQELLDIGVEDYLGQQETLCIIEWPEKVERLLVGKKCIEIFLEHSIDERKIVLNASRILP